MQRAPAVLAFTAIAILAVLALAAPRSIKSDRCKAPRIWTMDRLLASADTARTMAALARPASDARKAGAA